MAQRGVAPFTAFIGAEVEELREGYARLSLVLREHHTNPNGVMHGGVITTLMDSALGASLGALRGQEARRHPHATVDMNAGFLAGARPGDTVVVEGRVVHMGRSIAFGEAEARRHDGDLIAKGRLTFAIRGGSE